MTLKNLDTSIITSCTWQQNNIGKAEVAKGLMLGTHVLLYWPVFAVAAAAATIERELNPRPSVDSLLRSNNK